MSIVHANPPQAGTDKSYVHHQDVPSAIWLITHNLGKYPTVRVVDSGDNEWMGHIEYLSLNQLRITFMAGNVPASFGGKAYLN